MVVNCIVRDCSSEWYPACNSIFHKFPSDLSERKKWLDIIPLKRTFFENAKICSLHFKESDYESCGRRLRSGATPFFKSSSEVILPDKAPTEHANKASAVMKFEEIYMPSSSHDVIINPRLLRDPKKEMENIPPAKKSLLLELLEGKTENMVEKEFLEQIDDMNTSPVQIFFAHKSTQARIKTSREKELEKRNKTLAQKVARLNKSLNKLKSLEKIVKSYRGQDKLVVVIKE